ncbi:cell surface protein, partial [Bifidobacteriaceae bacterium NR019]
FDDAKSQEMMLLPQLRNSIDKNAELSRKLTEKLKQNQNNTNKQQKPKKHNNHFKNDNSDNSSKDKKQSDSSKPQLNNAQRNKVENLLKQNDHVDSKYSQDQEDQQGLEKTEKRTKTDESSNKPW